MTQAKANLEKTVLVVQYESHPEMDPEMVEHLLEHLLKQANSQADVTIVCLPQRPTCT